MENESSQRPQRKEKEPDTEERARLEALVEKVIGAAYEVSNVLGAGFLEKIYERALIEELTLRGVRARPQATFPVAYKGKHIGTYAADLVVDDCLAGGSQMRRAIFQRASGTMHQLLEGFRTPTGSTHQLSSSQSGMASHCPQTLIRVHSRLFAVVKHIR